MKNLLIKYKEIILYLFFGGCTTVVNIGAYAAATRVIDMNVVQSTVLAWVVSVVFAYITNKNWVFESKAAGVHGICGEVLSFVGCRLFSGILDVFLMWFLVDILGFRDMIIKIMSNIIVIIINYVASKFWIFKKG